MKMKFELKIISIITIWSCLLPYSRTQLTDVFRTDIMAAVNSTTLACQTTIDHCIALSQEVQILLSNEKYCYAMRLEFSGISARHCLVNLGFCTVNEFNFLERRSCENNIIGSNEIILETTSKFYDRLNSTSRPCLENMISCIRRNPLATLYKQQKSFCYLVDGNSTSTAGCMIQSGSCTLDEVERLRGGACNETKASNALLTDRQDYRLSEAVHASSFACQTRLDKCLSSGADDVFEMLMKGRYCELIDVNDEDVYSARNCLTSGGQCSEDEIMTLKQAACVGCVAKSSFISLIFLVYSLHDILLRYTNKLID